MATKKQIEAAFRIAAKTHDVSKQDILSPKNNVRAIKARKLFTLICYDILEMSYEEIAPLLGKSDRTTILHYKNQT